MNRPITLLHVVGGKDISHPSELVEETIFKPEKGSWSNDRGFWEDATDNSFTSRLL
jgi:hypothetical protein